MVFWRKSSHSIDYFHFIIWIFFFSGPELGKDQFCQVWHRMDAVFAYCVVLAKTLVHRILMIAWNWYWWPVIFVWRKNRLASLAMYIFLMLLLRHQDILPKCPQQWSRSSWFASKYVFFVFAQKYSRYVIILVYMYKYIDRLIHFFPSATQKNCRKLIQ